MDSEDNLIEAVMRFVEENKQRLIDGGPFNGMVSSGDIVYTIRIGTQCAD